MLKTVMLWMLVTMVTEVLVLCEGNRLHGLNTVDNFMNICMDGQSHKSLPGQESELFSKVSI